MKRNHFWVLRKPEDDGAGGAAGGGVPADGGLGSADSGGGDAFDLGAAVEAVASELSERPGSGEGAGAAEAETPSGKAAESPPAGPAEGETPAAPPAPAAPSPGGEDRPPSGWKAEAAAKWSTLSQDIRAEIQRRESDFHKGLEIYKADAQVGRPMRQVLQPYERIFAQYGIDPTAQVADLLRVNYTLALGTPDQKLAVFRKIAQDYNIPMQGADPAEEPAFVDPQVAALQQRIDALQYAQERRDQEAVQQRRQGLAAEIADFASKNEHFDAVSDAMAKILRANPGESLKGAYEAACWATPEVRAKMIAKEQADAAAAQKATEKARADAAAAAAGLNKKSKLPAGTVTGNKQLGSMDDTLAATFREIQARG